MNIMYYITVFILILGASSCGSITEDAHTGIQDSSEEPLKWYSTCGDPMCRENGHRDSGNPACTSEQTPNTTCTQANALCDPQDACNYQLICTTSDPKQSEYGCPISERRFKEKINYLTSTDRRKIVDEVLHVKLATYQYIQGVPAPSGPQLGFIIDDTPNGTAVSSDGRHVNLYAYTSMAIATLQEQAKEIEALKAEIKTLKRH